MFSVLTGGYNLKHPASFHMDRPYGIPSYTLLILKSQAQFVMNGAEFSAEPNSSILISRNTPYSYYNPYGEYCDDYLRFECSDDELFHHSGIVFNELFNIGNVTRFTFYIQQILWEHSYAHQQFKEMNENFLIQVLMNNLIHAYQSKENKIQYNPYYNKLQHLRLTIQSSPEANYNVQELSESLGISTSYFQHLYTKLFGISFQNELIKMRIEYSKFILSTTDFTIEKISEMCGYSSDIHFYRQFRKINGITPTEYRRLFYTDN